MRKHKRLLTMAIIAIALSIQLSAQPVSQAQPNAIFGFNHRPLVSQALGVMGVTLNLVISLLGFSSSAN